MTAKHTPGPWSVSKVGLTNDGGRPVVTDDVRIAVVDCQSEVSRKEAWRAECEERDANARLIAAAPALYETLKVFLEQYLELVNSGDAGSWDPEKEHKVMMARNVIADVEWGPRG